MEFQIPRDNRMRTSAGSILSFPLQICVYSLTTLKLTLDSSQVNALREPRALVLSLDDTKTVVDKPRHMVNTLVGIPIAIILLKILRIATTKFLLTTSQLLLMGFIFGNSCNTLESIIFLFVMHPFDMGDHCEVYGVEEQSTKGKYMFSSK